MYSSDIPEAKDASEMVNARRNEIINALLSRIGAAIRGSIKKMVRVELREDEVHVAREVIEHLKKLGYSSTFNSDDGSSSYGHLTITWRDELRSR